MNKKAGYTEFFLKSAGYDYSLNEIEKYKSAWWFNHRDKEIGGMRFTDDCLEFISSNTSIKKYEVPIPDNTKITPQILIWLDHFLESPWYLKKNKIVVLSEKLAFELYLFSGDLRKLGISKTLAKNYQFQD
jgi:hypothetical protein